MGRTGKLTPVAIFNPIDIDGTEVNRASLHNISIMEELGIKERGQLLEVFKSNMIIPQVKRVVPEMTCDVWMPQNIIYIPEVCPICGSPTKIIQENDSIVLYCDNPNCEGKLLNRIEHFFSKKGLDIKGISKATIEKLIDWGWVNEISDIFTLSKYEAEWKNKAGFGEKSVDNILSAIKEGCNTNLESVISAAGIPLIGRTVARELAKRYQTYDSFKKDIDGDFDFSSLDGFGYEMNKSLKNYNYKELDYIVENFLILNNKIEENKEQNLKDLIFCITGKTHLYKNRAELQKEIEDKGGRVVSSISSKVNYLINNDINSTSTKNTQAKKLNIPILSEEEFKVKFI
jgi:DNA ligase (NAD+)